ncbi:ketoacyl-ACP synthase III [Catellatospora sp. NPDC049609]|uniref:3-oxoacyl-ACP synthase III family protein n=1 Tax=Catellatospora sp. NPDC049609 TaxID=3155505 RepID=UPI003425A872
MATPTGILATGSYLPKHEVTNEDIAERAGVTPEWIAERTEILTRRYAAPHEATSDLAVQAAGAALEQAGISADQIDYIILSTSTGDSPQPPTSHHVQREIGASRAVSFDINVVCSGFVYGLALAESLTTQQPGKHALVIGADIYSRILDPTDRRTAVLFGDGAGAAVVGPVPAGTGFVGFDLASRGELSSLIRVEAGGSRRPASAETIEAGEHYFRMEGRAVSEYVMAAVPPAITALADRLGVGLDEIQHFVPHQPNGRLLTKLVNEIGIGNATVHRTLERYGNAGSASVAVTLDQANRSGALQPGDLVLLAGFGGGMAMGSCLLRWSARA